MFILRIGFCKKKNIPRYVHKLILKHTYVNCEICIMSVKSFSIYVKMGFELIFIFYCCNKITNTSLFR